MTYEGEQTYTVRRGRDRESNNRVSQVRDGEAGNMTMCVIINTDAKSSPTGHVKVNNEQRVSIYFSSRLLRPHRYIASLTQTSKHEL